MPRKARIEYPGAIYHIISRGNYRKDLFTVAKTGEQFEKAIHDTVERCRWELFAYVIMSNHYHLAIRTPEPNLVEGMKWLQSSFASRFNRFTGERGHVFQGRYKSIVVEEDRPLTSLIDYIHLNPVRAKIVTIENLPSYRLSSFAHYWECKGWRTLAREQLLRQYELPNTKDGMRKYLEHLRHCDEGLPRKAKELAKYYCQGWYLGSQDGKRALAKRLADTDEALDWEGVDRQELNETRWEALMVEELSARAIDASTIASTPKGADWKVAIARRLRAETTASNPWIADRLNMGHPSRISNLIREARTS